jgi:hypothetical protein
MLMETAHKSQIAFFLTSRRDEDELDALDPAARPALLARYRDLTTLRYDFPLVLVDGRGDDGVRALSAVVDRVLRDIAHGDDGDRVALHVLRQERKLRALVAEGATGTLTQLWDIAAERLGAGADGALHGSLVRARAALGVDGALVDCDAALPARLVTHAWRAEQEAKAARFRSNTARLVQKLSDMLRADFAASAAGRSAESLRASVGGQHADLFDFGAMSRVLIRAAPGAGLSDARRERVRSLVSVLEAQRFHPPAGTAAAAGTYAFAYTSCNAALAAYRERLPAMAELARALAIAELEVAGEFREATHGALFDALGSEALGPEDAALFPDYLVCVTADRLDATERATLLEILAAGLPMKIVVQSDDLLDESHLGDGHLSFGATGRQLANVAIGQNDVYVMQSAASHLYQFRGRLRDALRYAGPALFNVFSGASAHVGALPPFLCAAAAMESRVFPAFAYDPAAGADWASRFDLAANPDVESDWPVRGLTYEDENQQAVTQDVAFTALDFIACDRRHAKHFARVPRERWSDRMVAAVECISRETGTAPDRAPCLLMVDDADTLQKVLVDDKLLREARRCRELWRSLQELGGVHNSHAERLLARERQRRDESAPATQETPAAPAAAPAAETAAAAEPAERASDDAWIETARCTTCNECTTINAKMFAYNENRQAYIADPSAGTYAQLVEAAESCQVSIIHPGKPRNPDEPNLEELMKRAEPFQ